jgi:hypothetical protein
MHSSTLQTLSSDLPGISIPQMRQCLCDGVSACALDRFGMFFAFFLIASASTIYLTPGELRFPQKAVLLTHLQVDGYLFHQALRFAIEHLLPIERLLDRPLRFVLA